MGMTVALPALRVIEAGTIQRDRTPLRGSAATRQPAVMDAGTRRLLDRPSTALATGLTPSAACTPTGVLLGRHPVHHGIGHPPDLLGRSRRSTTSRSTAMRPGCWRSARRFGASTVSSAGHTGRSTPRSSSMRHTDPRSARPGMGPVAPAP
jgi:hypothetical protein